MPRVSRSGMPALAASIALILGSGIAAAQDAPPTAKRKSAEAAAGATVAVAATVPATVAAQGKPVEEPVEEKSEPDDSAAAEPAPVEESGDDDAEPVQSQTPTSTEQGQTPMSEAFGPPSRREMIRQQRKAALEATKYNIHLRTFYLDRDKFDDSQSEAWAAGG